ncbi:MAG: hypothetical protein A2W22_04695 [Candidatus Levybacteria bacterium RBG_16_35_11]|nr:MAG: hypothetical protein A2W22_04695 [Candidatus Levybacteria bacterium RBG_16_35_11]
MGEVVETDFADKDIFSKKRKIFTSFQIQNLSDIKVGKKYVPFYDGKRAPEFTVISEPESGPLLGKEVPGLWVIIESILDGREIRGPISLSDYGLIPNENGLYCNYAFLVKTEDADKVQLGKLETFPPKKQTPPR